MIAKEPHPRLVVSDPPNDRAKLARHHPSRQPHNPAPSATADAQRNQTEITDCGISSVPGIFCKPDSPLLPRNPLSFWNRCSANAKVMACVRIDRYTPVTRLRNASQPKTSASTPGTAMTNMSWIKRLSAKAQMGGNSEPPTTPKICVPMASLDLLRRGWQFRIGQ